MQTQDDMRKLYIESSTLCNLNCTMCMRNTWRGEPMGHMDMNIYRQLIAEAANIPSIETVFFGGVGEPTFHPQFVEMVALAAQAGKRVECVSNGSLLDTAFTTELVKAGLNQVWVSVDGFSKQSYEDIRQNGDFATVVNNLWGMAEMRRFRWAARLKLGLTFVAMKSNLGEMAQLMKFARYMRASDVRITHVLPYSEQAAEEALYMKTLYFNSFRQQHEDEIPEEYLEYGLPMHLDFPLMDINPDTTQVMATLLNSQDTYSVMGLPLARRANYCRFVQEGNVFVKWDGSVTQCMALLHPSVTYLMGRRRELQPHSFGSLHEASLGEIWADEEYAQFRERVRDFNFSMCTNCASCELVESNQEDCLGNKQPTCGACLWAQGFIQCP